MKHLNHVAGSIGGGGYISEDTFGLCCITACEYVCHWLSVCAIVMYGSEARIMLMEPSTAILVSLWQPQILFKGKKLLLNDPFAQMCTDNHEHKDCTGLCNTTYKPLTLYRDGEYLYFVIGYRKS